jgi:hypothetical protein
VDTTLPAAPPGPTFIRVSAAKKLYFGGAMSLRWWYKQIESGRLPHFRAGGAVLLRPADVEALVAEMFRARQEPVQPEPSVAPPAPEAPRRGSRRNDGLRFFPSNN